MGGWGAVTNFSDRICDNKGSCKKSAHLDLKWARNGCLKFLLVVGGWIDKNYRHFPQKWTQHVLKPIIRHLKRLSSPSGGRMEILGVPELVIYFD